MKRLYVIFFLLVPLASYSQNLIESRQNSFYSYIFKLSEKEAGKIYRKDAWKVDMSYFHTLVDSFPTDSVYHWDLPEGHYLLANSANNKWVFELNTIADLEAKVMNNKTDLIVQLYDLDGGIISDAEVRIGWTKIDFEEKTKSYRLRKASRKGLLKIRHNELTVYYRLDKLYKNSAFQRLSRSILYKSPVKYVWGPARFLINIPIDAVRTAVKGYATGTIYSIGNLFQPKFKPPEPPKYKGYLIYNKPKYKPGDTVKFKAFVVDKNGKPLDKPVQVKLRRFYKEPVWLKELSPYRPGGFTYEFKIVDSLELRLDKRYEIVLEDRKGDTYISGSFLYEDYLLTKSEFSLRNPKDRHFLNEPFVLFAKGTDDNGLVLPDGRVKLTVMPLEVTQLHSPQVFVPDTIWTHEQPLDMTGETRLAIPDSVFPAASMKYRIYAAFFTSDNERTEKHIDVNYYRDLREIDFNIASDTLRIRLSHNNQNIPTQGYLKAYDRSNKLISEKHVELPVNERINPMVYRYVVLADSLSREFFPGREDDMIRCYSDLSSDSLCILVENPINLSFTYFIYSYKKEVAKGFSDSLNYCMPVRANRKYYVSLQYMWGGEPKSQDFEIPVHNNNLNIELEAPRLVYPGQEVEVTVNVTDAHGDPASRVDLTALSIKQKFDFQPPAVPYLGKPLKNRAVINEFTLNDISAKGFHPLSDSLLHRFGLDSIAYYQFIYPDKQPYKVEVAMDDSVTQFAPFVLKDGAIQPVHVIYVDRIPVYFSWNTPAEPYSIPVRPGSRYIQLRTKDRLITIKHIDFKEGVKTFFSVNDHFSNEVVMSEKMPAWLTLYERNSLRKYILPYRHKNWNKPAYIRQGNHIHRLSAGPHFVYSGLTGPVGNLSFRFILEDGYEISLDHEPGFEYDFEEGLVKMRTVDPFRYPVSLYYNPPMAFSDRALTDAILQAEWEKQVAELRKTKTWQVMPGRTSAGRGTLEIRLANPDTQPLNYVLIKSGDPGRSLIYPGNTNLCYNLEPGVYHLSTLLADDFYFTADPVTIKANGVAYLTLSQPGTLKRDSFSISLSEKIRQLVINPASVQLPDPDGEGGFYREFYEASRYDGPGRIIDGRVVDQLGEGIPGVTVAVLGSAIGTITDLNGFYSLKIPHGYEELVFSSVGYVSEQVSINQHNFTNIRMMEDVMQLQEIVVVGYGVQTKSNLTGSVSSVQLSGTVPGVIIRGMGTSSSQPLYIVDGIPVSEEEFKKLSRQSIVSSETLSGAAATAIYGARGANGVVLATTGHGPALTLSQKGADYDQAFYRAAMSEGSIRRNFSDYAFWQPKLITDSKGKASFRVKFPDDVTNWHTMILAIDDKKRSGKMETHIKSYKPLMGQLSSPEFLIDGDSVYVIGKALNYTVDTFEVSSKFEVNGVLRKENRYSLSDAVIDTCLISASSEQDSLTIAYFLEKDDGYFDGEERKIPVNPAGMKVATGYFHTLDKDTAITLNLDPGAGPVKIYARADLLDIALEEADHVIGYRYMCNEQVASKLKSLLVKKQIYERIDRSFEEEGHIRRFIDRLKKHQTASGLWGWWEGSLPSYWISLHTLEALIQAEQMGYDTGLEKDKIAERLVWEIEDTLKYDRLRLLQILDLLEAQIDYEKYIKQIEKDTTLSLTEKFAIVRLRQRHKFSYSLDSIMTYKKETLLGNLYFAEGKQNKNNFYRVNDNYILATLEAYRVLHNEKQTDDLRKKIINFFLEIRRDGYWRNTYESSLMLETILPVVLKGKKNPEPPKLILGGDLQKTIAQFPYETTLDTCSRLTLAKSGDLPVYFTAYQEVWEEKPEIKDDYFAIRTYWNGKDSLITSKPGERITLKVDLHVKKKADYVALEIPIPAGCTYGRKLMRHRNETYREYFKSHTAIFIERLEEGYYEFEIELTARYAGSYQVNPAKAEAMYFPVFYGNSRMNSMIIKQE